DMDGNPLFKGPFLAPSLAKDLVNGLANISVTLDFLPGNTATKFRIRALFSYGATAILSDVFTVSPPAALAADVGSSAVSGYNPSTNPDPKIVPVGLGSY